MMTKRLARKIEESKVLPSKRLMNIDFDGAKVIDSHIIAHVISPDENLLISNNEVINVIKGFYEKLGQKQASKMFIQSSCLINGHSAFSYAVTKQGLRLIARNLRETEEMDTIKQPRIDGTRLIPETRDQTNYRIAKSNGTVSTTFANIVLGILFFGSLLFISLIPFLAFL